MPRDSLRKPPSRIPEVYAAPCLSQSLLAERIFEVLVSIGAYRGAIVCHLGGHYQLSSDRNRTTSKIDRQSLIRHLCFARQKDQGPPALNFRVHTVRAALYRWPR